MRHTPSRHSAVRPVLALAVVAGLVSSLLPVAAWAEVAPAPDVAQAESTPADQQQSPVPVTPVPAEAAPSPETTDGSSAPAEGTAETPHPEDSVFPEQEETDAGDASEDGGAPPVEAPEEEPDLKGFGGDTTPDEAVVEEGADERFRTLSLVGWDAGNIITDAVMFTSGVMSASSIQSFLNSKVPSCQAGYVCLKNYREATQAKPATTWCPRPYAASSSDTAAQIISKSAVACGVNEQVLLVMLQKEQGLVTHTWPSDWRYTIAMGLDCPDTAPCSTGSYGFQTQVYGAAERLRQYAFSGWWTYYPVGQVSNILYHPNADCGRGPVHIANRATAALYYYTPYQPNQAALNAGYGTGDGCSAYGNRNFYNYFTDWFGSTRTLLGHNPIGQVTSWENIAGGVRVAGWVFDPDSSSPVHLRVKSGSDTVGRTNADRSTPALPAEYAQYGPTRGFTVDLELPPGRHELCVTANNIGAGSNRTLACRTVSTTNSGPPRGEIESWSTIPGGVRITGWALDPDTASAVQLRVKSEEKTITRVHANRPSASAQARYPGFGSNRGFTVDAILAPGQQTVCVAANNIGDGDNRTLGCFNVSPPGGRPFGAVDTVEPIPGGVRVSGWSIDPDTLDAVHLRIKVAGSVAARADANRAHARAATTYPAFDNIGRGFSADVPLPAGTQEVCVTANNVGTGTHTTIGCSKVAPLAGDPFGYINEWEVVPGGVRVKGWAIDPDTAAPISVRAKTGNEMITRFTADGRRGDVGRRYPLYGENHAFELVIPLEPGSQNVCLVANNVGYGSNRTLGCQQVAPPSGSPFGYINELQPVVGGVRIKGWAIDPDTTSPVTVRVKSGSTLAGRITASSYRADLASRYPAYGGDHAFDETVALASGRHELCVVANNLGIGSHRTLRCESVIVP